VASSLNQGFVVVWAGGDEDGFGYGVFAQRFTSAGMRFGGEFLVNSYTTGDQWFPRAAVDASGNFVVVWRSDGQDGSGYGVFGQRFSSIGAPLGIEFRINTVTSDSQEAPAVAFDGSGKFVVTWQSTVPGVEGANIVGQVFASDGSPLATEFRVNTYTTYSQSGPSVDVATNGDFVVAWSSLQEDGSLDGVFAQRLCLDPLTSICVTTAGSVTVCSNDTGGIASVTDSGGGSTQHQWGYKTSVGGMFVPISLETGSSYSIKGSDFAGGAPGTYYLYCRSTPHCGAVAESPNVITVTVTADPTPPAVTAPSAATTTQTLCQ
jgi:hypothetical protein